MQIYKGLDIGTAKASAEEQAEVPHHLLDIIEPGENFSVSAYTKLALEKIREIFVRGNQPILCGGTGQYVSALVEGLQFIPVETDDKLRQNLTERYELEGGEALWQEINEQDPKAAELIHPNNKKRVIRALEVMEMTGKTMSQVNQDSRLEPPAYDYQVFIINHDRPILYNRINRRVDQMLENGLVEETKWLLSLNLPADTTCLQAIGYKEIVPYIQGVATLEEAAEELKRNTRRYAKRQLTWFRKKEYARWIENKSPSEAAQIILNQ